MLTEQAIARVRAYRLAKGLSKRALAREAGLAAQTVMSIDAPDWSPSVATLLKLEALVPDDFEAAA